MPKKVSEEVTLDELHALKNSVLDLLKELDAMIATKQAAGVRSSPGKKAAA